MNNETVVTIFILFFPKRNWMSRWNNERPEARRKDQMEKWISFGHRVKDSQKFSWRRENWSVKMRWRLVSVVCCLLTVDAYAMTATISLVEESSSLDVVRCAFAFDFEIFLWQIVCLFGRLVSCRFNIWPLEQFRGNFSTTHRLYRMTAQRLGQCIQPFIDRILLCRNNQFDWFRRECGQVVVAKKEENEKYRSTLAGLSCGNESASNTTIRPLIFSMMKRQTAKIVSALISTYYTLPHRNGMETDL